jgi:sugar phosphate isomerase/epimerase
VHDVELVRIIPEIDVNALEPFLAAAAELGAKHVITAPYDPDLARLTDRLAAIAGLAAGYGLGAVLEFFPWTLVPDIGAAFEIVEATKRADVGVLVDTLHFSRSGSALDQLDRIPHARLPFVHVCDAPVQDSYTTEELLHAGRVERLPPGEGAIDIREILSHMPKGILVALEVPMTAMSAAEGAEAVALRVRLSADRLFNV